MPNPQRAISSRNSDGRRAIQARLPSHQTLTTNSGLSTKATVVERPAGLPLPAVDAATVATSISPPAASQAIPSPTTQPSQQRSALRLPPHTDVRREGLPSLAAAPAPPTQEKTRRGEGGATSPATPATPPASTTPSASTPARLPQAARLAAEGPNPTPSAPSAAIDAATLHLAAPQAASPAASRLTRQGEVAAPQRLAMPDDVQHVMQPSLLPLPTPQQALAASPLTPQSSTTLPPATPKSVVAPASTLAPFSHIRRH